MKKFFYRARLFAPSLLFSAALLFAFPVNLSAAPSWRSPNKKNTQKQASQSAQVQAQTEAAQKEAASTEAAQPAQELFTYTGEIGPIFLNELPLYKNNNAAARADSVSNATDSAQSANGAGMNIGANSAAGAGTGDALSASLVSQSFSAAPTSSAAESDFITNAIRNYSPMMNNDIMAFYGHPKSASMGIVGQHSLEALDPLLVQFAAEYDAANGVRGVIPALYLIYGTCWPEGEIGYMNKELTTRYIEYALERGWIVYLDHQIGKYTVEQSVERLLPFLKYPNVHLALDPEWRTTKPMQEIGSVTAAELNTAQQMIQDYLIANNLPEKRMLVVHQFKPWMISRRDEVRSNFERVNLIHCADGFGNPHQKRSSYAMNAEATNIPLKSFKLFSKPAIAGAGWDEPLMTPEEVLALEPRPYLIMMQ